MEYEKYISDLKKELSKKIIKYVFDKNNRKNIKSKKVEGTKFTIKIVNDPIFINKMNKIGNEINYHTIYYIAKYGFDENIPYNKEWVKPSIQYFEELEKYEICHLIQKKFENE